MGKIQTPSNGKMAPELVDEDELLKIRDAYAKVFFPRRPHHPAKPSPEELAELRESLDSARVVKIPRYQSEEYSGPVYVVVWPSGPGCVSVFVENDDQVLRYVPLEVFD